MVISLIINSLNYHNTCIGCIQNGAENILERIRQELIHVCDHSHEASRAETYNEIAQYHVPHTLCLNYLPITN